MAIASENMKKLASILILTCLYGCTYNFNDLDIINHNISVSLYTYEILNGYEISADAYIQGADHITIRKRGHCYLFDSSELPDTSDAVSLGTESSPNSFNSILYYSSLHDSLFVRAFIVFGDSIIYSGKGRIPLKN